MDFRKFSLNFLPPSDPDAGGSEPSPRPDPAAGGEWADAIRYYGEAALKILQEGGTTSVRDLFEKAKKALNMPDLQLDQLVGVVSRMIDIGMIQVVERGETWPEYRVALPIKR
jgi:hypothetical protein